MKNNILVVVDNGHGWNTPGKRSPDGRLLEYKYTRETARRLVAELKARGISAVLLVPEEYDVSITERCRRVNAYCEKYGSGNVVLVSLHVNAAGTMGWHTARGWLAMVDDAASAKAKRLASLLFDAVAERGLRTRQHKPGQKWYLYHEALGKPGVRLGILKGTRCPAVLTENLFMDNRDDCDYLLSEEGRAAIVAAHRDALVKYVETL